MALHIRDFRQSDRAELSRLCETGRLIGTLPPYSDETRILSGVRDDRLAAAIWIRLEGKTGIILAIATTQTANWLSNARELIAEASLWLASRGASCIELSAMPDHIDVLATLADMNFRPDQRAGVLCRLIPARSAA